MRVKPMLGDWEIPRISSIKTAENRAFVEFPIPGRVGSLYQDMNNAPMRLIIHGSLYGDEVRDQFLEDVRSRFQAGAPLTFVADILTATELQFVIIEELYFTENGQHPDEIDYVIVLSESPPPPPPPDPFGGLDAGLLDQAGDFMDSVTGALDVLDALGSVPDFGNPTEDVTELIDGVSSATSNLTDILSPLQGIFGTDE